MDHPSLPFSRLRVFLTPAALVLALAASSCLTPSNSRKSPAGGPSSPEQELARRDAAIAQLKEQVADKEAQVKQLEQSLLSQQRMLDEAIQEVVRVKAKQRSLESRAEAASEMAEAEIALKSLEDREPRSTSPELAAAKQLLARAGREFESQNFGGALYLVGQAKSQIKLGMIRPGAVEPASGREDEIPFAVPLSLKVSARGNLREGPGAQFKVIATLEEGTRLTGFFSRGVWLRVETEDGTTGWIHRSLVTPN